MLVLGYALAVLVGLSLGLIGGGGAILAVPIFVYVLGFDAKVAIAMSLPVVGAASLIGAIGHWRAGNVQIRTAAIFGIIAMVGAYGGARLSVLTSSTAQLSLLALVMLAAAIAMFRSARRDSTHAEPAPEMRTMPVALLIPIALSFGILTGLIGIGGGFMVVPALVLLARIPMKQAIGTSLLVIAMNSISGSLGYIGQRSLPWAFMLAFIALAAVGTLIGTRMARHVSQSALKQTFAVFLVIMSAFILYKIIA